MAVFAARHLGLVLGFYLEQTGGKGALEIGANNLELFEPFLREIGLEISVLATLSL